MTRNTEYTEYMQTDQNGNDAFMFLLHQVTDDFVVEIFHSLPLNRKQENVILYTKLNNKCIII